MVRYYTLWNVRRIEPTLHRVSRRKGVLRTTPKDLRDAVNSGAPALLKVPIGTCLLCSIPSFLFIGILTCKREKSWSRIKRISPF